MSEFVVVDADGRFLGFGSKSWCVEFPDARTFDSKVKAIAAARHAKTLCDIVEDYGCETQRVVDTVQG